MLVRFVIAAQGICVISGSVTTHKSLKKINKATLKKLEGPGIHRTFRCKTRSRYSCGRQVSTINVGSACNFDLA